jgi:hypothetical protein
VYEADHRHCRLLRARRVRPRCRTSEKRDELASPHVLLSLRGSDPTTSLEKELVFCIAANLTADRPLRVKTRIA